MVSYIDAIAYTFECEIGIKKEALVFQRASHSSGTEN